MRKISLFPASFVDCSGIYLQVARSDSNYQCIYRKSAQIQLERKTYYAIIEKILRDDLDITGRSFWFLLSEENQLNDVRNTGSALPFLPSENEAIVIEPKKKL